MIEFITRFFRREEASKNLAKERLRLVLMSDRVSLAPDIFETMKVEMLDVIRRYLDVDERALEMRFENAERQFLLLANIPVLHVKTHPAKPSTKQSTSQSRDAGVRTNGSVRSGDLPTQQPPVAAPTTEPPSDPVLTDAERPAAASDLDIPRLAPKRRRRRRKKTAQGDSSPIVPIPSPSDEEGPPAAPPALQ